MLPVALFVLFSCNIAGDAEYQEMAKDACDCVNKATKNLSPEMIDVIVSSDGDKVKLQEKMAAYAKEFPFQAVEDATKMNESMMPELSACLKSVEQKYKNVYSTESDEEIQIKLLAFLKKTNGCESAAAFFKLSMDN